MEVPMELSGPPSPGDNEQSTGDIAISNPGGVNKGTASGEVSQDVSIIEDLQQQAQLQENLDITEVTGLNLSRPREVILIETGESSLENSSNAPTEVMNISSDSNTASMDSTQIRFVNNALEQMEIDGMTSEEISNLNVTVAHIVNVCEADSLGSAITPEPTGDDTVSITSDDMTEDDQNSPVNLPSTTRDTLVSTRSDEKENKEHCSTARPGEDKSDAGRCTTSGEVVVPLRRSRRAIKRRRYDDDTYDVRHVDLQEPLPRRAKPLAVNEPRAHAQIASSQRRSGQPTDSRSPSTSAQPARPIPIRNPVTTTSPLTNRNLYQTIIARGTSVTPVTVRTNSSTQCTSTSAAQPRILPSLTDDMYVVEAPSFVVPYVYEKPAVRPFREFVDEFGSQIEEQRAGEAREQNDHETNGAEERSDGRNADGDHQNNTDVRINRGVAKRGTAERRRGRNDDDNVSWDGESSTDSDNEILSDDGNKTVVIKDKVDSLEEMKDITGLTVEKVVTGNSDNYFNCVLGRFFMDIGHNLIQEFVQNDLLKLQNRKLVREKKAGHSTRATESSIASLKKNLEFSIKSNAPYRVKQHKCAFCSFQSDSMLVVAHHLETPHMKNNVYKCNYCSFEIRSPHDILYHMETIHHIRGKLERAPAYHQCANCPFEDNGKGKLARHLLPCSRKFKPEANLAPPIEWEPPAKIPKIPRSRNSAMGTYQGTLLRGLGGAAGGAGAGAGARPGALAPSSVTAGAATSRPSFKPSGRCPLAAPTRATPAPGAPLLRGGTMVKHNNQPLLTSNYLLANNGKSVTLGRSIHQPSISITPLPRQPPPAHTQPAHQSKSTFVICEVCDGYIKDLEQLRNHMHWIHKVKIHPKMIYNRPPLNCQKCQCRFFTDQGLERHLLGSHGLVTSSMQDAANKGKDAGRCPVCGRVYQWKLLNHVARDHNLTLKPAHLSYKCTVCTATFGMYKQFENHVYAAHSMVARRAMDRSKPTNTRAMLPPIRISDEVTIIPQPVKTPIKDK